MEMAKVHFAFYRNNQQIIIHYIYMQYIYNISIIVRTNMQCCARIFTSVFNGIRISTNNYIITTTITHYNNTLLIIDKICCFFVAKLEAGMRIKA